jgi:Tfp pilus assembly protein PilF
MLVCAMCMVAVAPPRAGRRSRVLPFAVALVITVAAVSLTRQAMTERFVDGARGALAADPARALGDADRALRLDPEVLAAYYVKAAALARFGEGDAARATLRAAAAKEPGEYVTWALLGDLAVRQGDIAGARRAYRRALEINPREPSLPPLIEDPRSALSVS